MRLLSSQECHGNACRAHWLCFAGLTRYVASLGFERDAQNPPGLAVRLVLSDSAPGQACYAGACASVFERGRECADAIRIPWRQVGEALNQAKRAYSGEISHQ